MELKVDTKSVAEVYKLQRNAALDDVAMLTAAVQALQAENERLRQPLEPTP